MKVLIAHAEGDEGHAEKIAAPLLEAGYEIVHRKTLLVGESFIEEVARTLGTYAPVILCASIRALGTGLAHRIVHAARAAGQPGIRVFVVQMEEEVYVSPLALDGEVAPYWKDPSGAITNILASLRRYYPITPNPVSLALRYDPESRYRDILLSSCNVIDLANLPASDRRLATLHLELRQLYVALRVLPEPSADDGQAVAEASSIRDRRRLPPRRRQPLGQRLEEARRLVLLGEPGAGKTTLLRWLATACLLRRKGDQEWKDLPDVSTLPDEDWLPILVRCRDLTAESLKGSLEDVLVHTLRRMEIYGSEGEALKSILVDRLAEGRAILLVDGLDEITDLVMRSKFCRQLEQVHLAFPGALIVATARTVGYREIRHRIGRGFEHLAIGELSHKDKNDFARRWCELTELPERRSIATKEFIQDIHSSDRIDRLAGNPMLLTCMGLVKRGLGRLPSRRADLYRDVLEALLNWRREVDDPIDQREAIPQLEYLAYSMCDLGVTQLREDEIVELFDRMRGEYPNIHAIRRRSSEEFLRLLERRTGLLVEAGSIRHLGRLVPIFEFRHLTFQEYLAGMAIVDGRFPERDRSQGISDHIAFLAGRTGGERQLDEEMEVVENWREALRICIVCCNDDTVDVYLGAILQSSDREDSRQRRARAVLAALCLADEPNASDDCARSILNTLADYVSENDGNRASGTSLDEAVVQISRSRWAEMLTDLMLNRFFAASGDLRSSFGGLCSEILAGSIPSGEKALENWLSDQAQELASDDPRRVVRAALALMFIGHRELARSLPEDIADGLLALLKRSSAEAHAASWALSWLRSAEIWKPLPQQMERILDFVSEPSSDIESVLFLNWVLADERYEEAVDALISRLDGEIVVFELISETLGEIGSPVAVPILFRYLGSSEKRAKIAAIDALGQIGGEGVVDALISLLLDPDRDVRRHAAFALGNVASPEAVPHLCRVLKDVDKDVSEAAAWGLGQIGSETALEALQSRLHDCSEDIPEVVNAVGKIGGENAINLLINGLSTSTGRRRNSIASVLCGLAYDRFTAGDIIGAADRFRQLVSALSFLGECDAYRNDLAYCSILLGDLDEASKQFDQIESDEVLWQHNRGVLAFLVGNIDRAKRLIKEVLSWIDDDPEVDDSPMCMLLVNSARVVRSVDGLPIGAASVWNLWQMGGMSIEWAQAEFERRYPRLSDSWMELFVDPS